MPAAVKQMLTVANAAFRMAVTEFNADREAFAESYRASHGEDATDAEKRLRLAWIGEDPKKDETKK